MDPNTVHIRKPINKQNAYNNVYQSLHSDVKSYKSHQNLEASFTETSNRQSKASNYDYRLRADRKDNFPNGYLEDWSSNPSDIPTESSSKHNKHSHQRPTKTIRSTSHQHSTSHKSLPYTSFKHSDASLILLDPSQLSTFSLEISDNMSSHGPDLNSIQSESTNMPLTSLKYTPVSIILSTQSNILLNKETSYDIRFSTGMIEGSGISINDNGNEISFQDDGSYRFEICGEATPFSDVDVKLVFYSPSFTDEIQLFSEITVPKDEGKLLLRGLATILPIQKGQKIYPRLIPTPDESIVLMSNTRLLIHRVA